MVFEDILNDCLERVAGGEDPSQCAGRYPDYAAELLPLLAMASTTIRVATSVPMRPSARARGFERMIRALAERPGRRWSRVPVFWRPMAKPIVLGFALVLLTAVAAGGTTIVSAESVPGDPLYWVKTTKESITLKMNGSDMAKAQTHALLAGERGDEMRKLISSGRLHEAESLVERMSHHLEESAMLAGVLLPVSQAEMPARQPLFVIRSTVKIRTYLQQDGAVLKTELLQLWLDAAPNQKPMVQQIMRRTQLKYQIFIGALDDGGPRGGPFWIIEPSGRGTR